MRSTLFAMVVGVAIAMAAKPASACLMRGKLELKDIKYASVVVVGRIVNYQIVRATDAFSESLRKTNGQESLLSDYARFDVLVDEALVGQPPKVVTVTWNNSTFSEPTTMNEGPYLIGLREPGSRIPPLRGPSATVLPSKEPNLITVLQAPCAPAFIFEASSSTAKAIRNLVAPLGPSDYPGVSSTWGDRLNPGGEAPLGHFAAHYLRSGSPATLVATDTVDEVSMNYSWADFHDIKSEDFQGYWVGKFRYDKEAPVHISIDQSHSLTRVIIDRRLVYEGSDNAHIRFTFLPGTHTVEVEHENNWHGTRLTVAFADATEPVERNELRQKLRALAPENTVVHYVQMDSSEVFDNSATLKLSPTPTPMILLLSSFHAVRWVIDNSANVDVRAIVYSSSSPGARVKINGTGSDIPRVLAEDIGSHYYQAYQAPRCFCMGDVFQCREGRLSKSLNDLSSLLGFPITGVSGAFFSKTLKVPEIAVTPEAMVDVNAIVKRVGGERNECRTKRDNK